MILDLAQNSGLFHATAEFSNAVLVAMLPLVSDVAKKLELPVPQPITRQHITRFGVTPIYYHDKDLAGCGFELQGGWMLGFHWGYLDHFETPHSYFALQNPDDIPKFVGPVKLSRDEAVQMARDTLKKLGISLESVFAEQEPKVTLPPKTRTGTVPHYRIEWLDPRSDQHSVDIEVNANAKRVERIYLAFNPHLRRPWPKIGVTPALRDRPAPPVNSEYVRKLIPIVFQAVDDHGKKLGLAVPRPLTTNHVARFHISDNGGWPHCELELTNGWRFIYRNSMVNGFYAPDNLFDSDRRPILIKDFVGKWNMSQTEAMDLVRRTLAKLNYPTNLVRMDFAPKVHTSVITNIPRYSFWWWCENEEHDDLVSKVEAEVDMDKRELKSLYFDHRAFWNKPPPIDVPLTLPASSNSHPAKTNLTRPKAPPTRSATRAPLKLPEKQR